MRQIYFISGLGADERVFHRLTLEGSPAIPIRWEQPLPAETIHDYARRLANQIDTTNEIILIGVSFGGIIAQEIANVVPSKRVIIISSIKSRQEFSRTMRLIAISRLYRYLPAFVLRRLGFLLGPYFFNTRTPEDKKLLYSFVRNVNNSYLQWAIDQLLQWNNQYASSPPVHIHGTKDRIFPINYIKSASTVKGGGHFMIVDQAREVSDLINQELRRL